MPATAPTLLRKVTALRYVTPLREGGSMPALVEADDDGLYVVKLRGAGQGRKALVAEIVAGEIARAVGLPVPELVIVDLDPDLARAEPDAEIQELIQASGGENVGLDFLPGSLPYGPNSALDEETAAAIVWLDALTLNVDRTPRNPNLLTWHGQVWLIDHGAALYRHHMPGWPLDAAEKPFPQIANHVLLARAASIREADARLAPRLTDDVLGRIAGLIPDSLLDEPTTERAHYLAFLADRLAGTRPWVLEAEEARTR